MNKKLQVSLHTAESSPAAKIGLKDHISKSSIVTQSTVPGVINNPDFNEVFSAETRDMLADHSDARSQELKVSTAGVSERDMHSSSVVGGYDRQRLSSSNNGVSGDSNAARTKHSIK